MENKESFQARIKPYFSPSDTLDIYHAYYLAKYGHRGQVRKELDSEGKPTRYFEHVRRVALSLIDDMKVIDKDMIITALLHDSVEDTEDLTAELLEHIFGTNVVSMIKVLSKVPKEGYIERFNNCHNWKVLAIKACDRLDNLRSLMVPGTTVEFQKKQVKETREKYYPIFNRMLTLTPAQHLTNVSNIRDEILIAVERASTIIEMRGSAV
jgi:(p)ppGpp synthase/HD superfamily hydrolase